MGLQSVLTMLGGIGLFLYGMKLMGQSLERFAGAKMERTLERLTNSKTKGVALGAGVTAVIQSSSATIIMVIGFLNAGIMKLIQAVPVIMGANIGTTVTAQILRLGDIDNTNIFLTLLKPTSFAPICVIIGAFVLLIAKKQKIKDKAGIAIGLGILFIGMSMMEASFAPLANSDEFMNKFMLLTNPILGLAAGAIVTMILQSSSASVGVLQAMSATGAITFSMAAPIIIGQNVGKCITVLLASIGTNKKAKRAVCIDITMSICGAILFMVVIYAYQYIIGFSFWGETVNRGNIADFHTLFNLVTCLVMLPLCNILIAFSGRIVRDEEHSKMDESFALLDERFISTPSVALEQCKKVLRTMEETAMENYNIVCRLLEIFDEKELERLTTNERFLDKTEGILGEYLVKITEQHINPEESRLATEMLHTVGDVERIGDHCMNLVRLAEDDADRDLKFSPAGNHELGQVKLAVRHILDMTMEAYRKEDELICHRVAPMEKTIDSLVETLKSRHIQRLQNGKCTTQGGIAFVEILTNLERISDHCYNISIHLHQRVTGSRIDIHRGDIFDTNAEEYKAMVKYYESIYWDGINIKETD